VGVTWTVVFSGRQLGTITSRSQGPPKGYGDIRTQAITTRVSDIPRIRIGAKAISYTGKPARSRPLLLVSAPNFRDPDAWKPATLSAAEKRPAIREFRPRAARSKSSSCGRVEVLQVMRRDG
jgi:hypothetical protein